MQIPLSNDPDVQLYYRARAIGGVAILLAVTAGFIALSLFPPQSVEHVSVNCHDPAQGETATDVAPVLAGCAPSKASQRSGSKGLSPPRMPPPSADATTDDPPIATF